MPPRRERAMANGTSTTLSIADATIGSAKVRSATRQDRSTSLGSTVADAGTSAISSNP